MSASQAESLLHKAARVVGLASEQGAAAADAANKGSAAAGDHSLSCRSIFFDTFGDQAFV